MEQQQNRWIGWCIADTTASLADDNRRIKVFNVAGTADVPIGLGIK